MTLLTLFLDGAAGIEGMLGGSGQMILMMVILFGIMYFFMIRPQQKKQKQIQAAREAIKTGDKVITAGGIHGKVKDVKDTYFVVEIADGIKIDIEKSSVFVTADQTEQK